MQRMQGKGKRRNFDESFYGIYHAIHCQNTGGKALYLYGHTGSTFGTSDGHGPVERAVS